MDWTTFLQAQQIILLFLIITLGFIIGRIRVWGFSFETSAILFVAMFFGNFGLHLHEEFQTLGLILFIYAIGLQAGPSIFNLSKKQGLQIYWLVFVLKAVGALTVLALAKLLSVDMDLAVGVFAGALTSTPGLAAAQESTQSPLTSAGYGMAYPFGVIGVILFIRFLPNILKINVKKEEQLEKETREKQQESVIHRHVLITNEALNGKSLRELNFNKTTGTIISRFLHDGKVIIPTADACLNVNDIVRIVGSEKRVEITTAFLGRVSDVEFPEVNYFESRKFVITNKEIVGKTIAELNLPTVYNANITRIRRGGVEFTAEADQKLNWGDRVRVAGEAAQMDSVKELFGDEMKKIEQGDIFAIITGILLGMAAGLIPFSIGKAIQFNLGITGGVLIIGLILGARGKIGPVIWQVPVPIITFMRELGLTLFLAVVGIKAGPQVINTLQTQGVKMVAMSVMITLTPMFVTALLARYRYRMMLINMLGLISGGMTSTPGLGASTRVTESQAPLVMYATVYPLAMLLMMIWVKILALF